MTKNWYKIYGCALLFCLSSESLYAAQKQNSQDELKVCTFKGKSDPLGELFFGNEFAKFCGLKLKKVVLETKQMQTPENLFKNSTCDVLAKRILITPELKKVAVPFDFLGQRLVVMTKTEQLGKFSSLHSLQDKKTEAVANSYISEVLTNIQKTGFKIKVNSLNKSQKKPLTDDIQALQAGKIDFFVTQFFDAVQILTSENLDISMAFTLDKSLEIQSYFINRNNKLDLFQRFRDFLRVSSSEREKGINRPFKEIYGYSYSEFYSMTEDSNTDNSIEYRIRTSRPEYFK